jgi:ribosomal-protein-alanine N-acetyltransferase
VDDVFDFASMPQLETKRLILRQVRPDTDREAFFDLFADPDVARFTDTGPFGSREEADEVIAWMEGIFSNKVGLRWAITRRGAENVLIGTAGYNHWTRWNDSAEIGYDLVSAMWGQGLMTEALEAILSFGFDRMGLNRIEADVTVGNVASERVLEGLGFTREGLLRQRGYWKGSYHDVWQFSLLRSDLA